MSEKLRDKISMSPVREAGLRKQDATEGESGNPNRAGSAAGSRTPNPALNRRVKEILARIECSDDMPVIDELLAAATERGRQRGIAQAEAAVDAEADGWTNRTDIWANLKRRLRALATPKEWP